MPSLWDILVLGLVPQVAAGERQIASEIQRRRRLEEQRRAQMESAITSALARRLIEQEYPTPREEAQLALTKYQIEAEKARIKATEALAKLREEQAKQLRQRIEGLTAEGVSAEEAWQKLYPNILNNYNRLRSLVLQLYGTIPAEFPTLEEYITEQGRAFLEYYEVPRGRMPRERVPMMGVSPMGLTPYLYEALQRTAGMPIKPTEKLPKEVKPTKKPTKKRKPLKEIFK